MGSTDLKTRDCPCRTLKYMYKVLKQLATVVVGRYSLLCEKFVLQASSVFVTVAHFYNGLIFVDRKKMIIIFTESYVRYSHVNKKMMLPLRLG